jgi:hypothetical protein
MISDNYPFSFFPPSLSLSSLSPSPHTPPSPSPQHHRCCRRHRCHHHVPIFSFIIIDVK